MPKRALLDALPFEAFIVRYEEPKSDDDGDDESYEVVAKRPARKPQAIVDSDDEFVVDDDDEEEDSSSDDDDEETSSSSSDEDDDEKNLSGWRRRDHDEIVERRLNRRREAIVRAGNAASAAIDDEDESESVEDVDGATKALVRAALDGSEAHKLLERLERTFVEPLSTFGHESTNAFAPVVRAAAASLSWTIDELDDDSPWRNAHSPCYCCRLERALTHGIYGRGAPDTLLGAVGSTCARSFELLARVYEFRARILASLSPLVAKPRSSAAHGQSRTRRRRAPPLLPVDEVAVLARARELERLGADVQVFLRELAKRFKK